MLVIIMECKNKSIWANIKQEKICPKLDKNIDVDVLIIGGGMTGLSTAYHLLENNLKICLVEKNEIASGVSSRTTGKLTYLQENIYSKIKTYLGKDKAKLYLESQIEAINLVKDIVQKENIECDLQKVSSYVFSNDNIGKLKKEMDLLKDFNVPINTTTKLPDETNVSLAFYIADSYVFHPLKYLHSLKNICLKKGVSIFENTNIISIYQLNDYYECHTINNIIKAKYIVLAVHYPYFLLPFGLPFKSKIEKSYIKAFQVDKNNTFNAITVSKPTLSIRYHTEGKNNYKIVLNGSHNSCIKFNEQDNFKNLLGSQQKDECYIWSNKDIITNDALPFIGSINDENTLLIGTGYNTWGMTNGSLAGKILADIIWKKTNKYQELFNPYRKINLGKLINFPIILGSTTCSMIKTKIPKQKNWYPDNVKFEKRNGKNVAIYIDENKKEHIVYNLCPHLKCSLIFNGVEKTWDCPCHGSRFDIDGNVIEGPSNYNITYKQD
ncbi:MAG: FAD-dependent oxidoreductase [Firmicutes bacterium]|nr:FAD-dependent oxidoreductase [Bacillota bacterium]